MNILPHKSWHVRTKANIAKVRKDQAAAAEEQKEQQRRIDLAEQEARINILRKKSLQSSTTSETITNEQNSIGTITNNVDPTEEIDYRLKTGEHINFFADLETGRDAVTKKNPEYLKEKKNEQEDYEKKIGYLTYLGQDTNESLGKSDWYDLPPEKTDPYNEHAKKIEVNLKTKNYYDPLNIIQNQLKIQRMSSAVDSSAVVATSSVHPQTQTSSSSSLKRKYSQLIADDDPTVKDELMSMTNYREKRKLEKKLRKKLRKDKHERKKKKKKDKKTKKINKLEDRIKKYNESMLKNNEKVLKLRAERIKREEEERRKADELLQKLKPKIVETPIIPDYNSIPMKPVKQKYNTQFNPTLAKQNYEEYR